MSIHFLVLAFTGLVFVAPGCSAGGPPFRDDPPAPGAPFGGRFAFDPPVRLHAGGTLGEVILEPAARNPEFTAFRLRIVGIAWDRTIRMRSYEGRAVLRDGALELRTDRCYLFGKREWEARMVPQERWACEHLIFSFLSPNGFQKRAPLQSRSAERTRYGDWLGPLTLAPLPLADNAPLLREPDKTRDPYFAGRIFELLPNGRIVVWGYRAGYLMKKGQVLLVTEPDGKPAGRLRIVSHPGDFLIAEPIDKGPTFRRGQIAYTMTWPKSEGLFGFRLGRSRSSD